MMEGWEGNENRQLSGEFLGRGEKIRRDAGTAEGIITCAVAEAQESRNQVSTDVIACSLPFI